MCVLTVEWHKGPEGDNLQSTNKDWLIVWDTCFQSQVVEVWTTTNRSVSSDSDTVLLVVCVGPFAVWYHETIIITLTNQGKGREHLLTVTDAQLTAHPTISVINTSLLSAFGRACTHISCVSWFNLGQLTGSLSFLFKLHWAPNEDVLA